MLILLLILIMGSATLLLTKLNKCDPRQPRSVATVQDLGAVRDALIGYSLINGNCLPCPDLNGDGQAQTPCGSGAPVAGFLPWATLNLGHADTWGRRLRYVVDPDFAGSGSCTVTQAMNGDIRVQGRDTTGAPFDLTLDSPAVVISHGANGYGAFNADGGALPNPPPGHDDEEINRTGTTLLIQRVPTDNPATIGGPFDDLVVWVSLSYFKTQLERVNGGPLPP
jgi:type II secretory pathway pseudopilin PulG